MNAPISKAELLAVLLAPARQNPERSRALPAEAYRDPADNAQLELEKRNKKVKPPTPPKRNKKWR